MFEFCIGELSDFTDTLMLGAYRSRCDPDGLATA
jgi:hypothetical protein